MDAAAAAGADAIDERDSTSDRVDSCTRSVPHVSLIVLPVQLETVIGRIVCVDQLMSQTRFHLLRRVLVAIFGVVFQRRVARVTQIGRFQTLRLGDAAVLDVVAAVGWQSFEWRIVRRILLFFHRLRTFARTPVQILRLSKQKINNS